MSEEDLNDTKPEGLPLLVTTTANNDEMSTYNDGALKERLFNELQSFEYVVGIEQLEDLPFYQDIQKTKTKKMRNQIKKLIASWVACLLFWSLIITTIYLYLTSTLFAVGWVIPILLVILCLFSCCMACAVQQWPVCCCCDPINTPSSSVYTMYSWQRKLSAMTKSKALNFSVYALRLWRLSPHYEMKWISPDGEKQTEKRYMKSPPNKRKLQVKDISKDFSQNEVTNLFQDASNELVQITVYKTWQFKDEEIKNEYIKSGNEFIVDTIDDLDGCIDIELNPIGHPMYYTDDYYVLNNKVSKKYYINSHCICMLLGLWCIYDTFIYCKLGSNYKSFVMIKEISLMEEEKKI